ncbi:hypothetical protein QR680_002151 [Steinernema hermaphroditum]|uniref:ZP domain-containing protein n=1 Tax=Steinernema hermaphroditum TaxID=289476 RepID=A0AA39H1I2_9BILA|nr:hypothetical protein QR680_002151 [Steinernema hermaphroditum]
MTTLPLYFTVVLLAVKYAKSTDFVSDVKWICDHDRVTIRLTTDSPFYGTVHTKLSRACAQNGTGEVNLQWSWSFDDLRQCGIERNSITGSLSFDLDVHEHRVLILEQDTTFQLSCASYMKDAEQFSNDDINTTSIEYDQHIAENFKIYMENEEKEVHEIPYGSSCFLKIRLLNSDQDSFGVRYKVKKCQAIAHDLTTVALTDDKGCPVSPAIMSNFEYDHGVATAKLPSMFRFPDNNGLSIRCTVAYCKSAGACKNFCNGVQDEPLNDFDTEETQKLLGAETLIESVSAIASTSLKVVDRRQMSFENSAEQRSAVSCRLPDELLTLYKICICLCFLFIAGCLVNLFVCLKRCSKRTPSRKSSPMPSLQTKEFWIESVEFDNVASSAINMSPPEPHFITRETDDRRSSFASYASFKKQTRSSQPGVAVQHRAEAQPSCDDVVFRLSSNESFGRTFHSAHSNSLDQSKHLSLISNDSIKSRRELHSLH